MSIVRIRLPLILSSPHVYRHARHLAGQSLITYAIKIVGEKINHQASLTGFVPGLDSSRFGGN
jgi:hypothetical protein